MSALLTKPEDGDRNRAPKLLTIFWTQILISLIFISLRVYVRVSIRSMGMDDYTMLVCWVGCDPPTIYLTTANEWSRSCILLRLWARQ